MFILFVQGIGHLGILLTGVFTSSRWTMLGALRSLYLYLSFDLIILLNWILLLPNGRHTASLSGGLIPLFSDQFSFGELIESQQLGSSNLFCYPLLFISWTFALLIEAGRIPADLSESESELVSGYNTEFGGFAYALLASSEYAVMLFASIMYVLFLLGGGSTIWILYLKVTFVFTFMILVRATLPRLRFFDLFSYIYEYVLPVQCFVMVLITLVVI